MGLWGSGATGWSYPSWQPLWGKNRSSTRNTAPPPGKVPCTGTACRSHLEPQGRAELKECVSVSASKGCLDRRKLVNPVGWKPLPLPTDPHYALFWAPHKCATFLKHHRGKKWFGTDARKIELGRVEMVSTKSFTSSLIKEQVTSTQHLPKPLPWQSKPQVDFRLQVTGSHTKKIFRRHFGNFSLYGHHH